ncbi:hypothetical protein CORC01_09839 [Colletotrichum orchidophilum]|uniref:Uncharacterized protein n=1 Tax=Colletotrichum orchidophilum TaxID=1209926 RepID=A0A1G4B0H2_9PEZI|nr:uncharacterized protein CORC01_09839 [Colletotrichum orchidophilum]OHE94920.1 hypothetical protein CORC01_09839 [Colletotrichum orchidophilum]
MGWRRSFLFWEGTSFCLQLVDGDGARFYGYEPYEPQSCRDWV